MSDRLASNYRASLTALKKRVQLARAGLGSEHCVTCPASRHMHIMAEALANPRRKGLRYPMLEEEPEHCAETLLVVLACLWEARQYLEWDTKTERWIPRPREEGR